MSLLIQIKAGTVVKLRSGGPKMTIVSDPKRDDLTHEDMVGCQWFNEAHILCSASFNLKALEIIA